MLLQCHTSNGPRRRWLRIQAALPPMAACLLSAVTACANGDTSIVEDTSDTQTGEVATDDLVLTPLRTGAFATPETLGGFCTDGVGVFLTAVDNAAELTLYVVAPAEIAAFGRPALYLTTQEDEYSQTETVEFEDVTLAAGESQVFRKEAQGTLLEVFADFERN